mgnify:CR=1 FL=1
MFSVHWINTFFTNRVTRPIIGIGMRFRDFELIFRKIELTFKQSIYTQSLVLFPLDNFMSYI